MGNAADLAQGHSVSGEKALDKSQFDDADEALKFLRADAEDGESEVVDEAQLLRKIDRMIVPIMFFCYMLQYLDKSLLNYASVMGIREDASLSTEEFGTLSWLFYLGFMVFQFPHAYMMQRFPTAKYLGLCVCGWGIAVTCTTACTDYPSLVAVRLILGIFESCVSPALILFSSMWYKKREQPRRVGFWYIGVGVAQIVGSLISFGFQHYWSSTFASWQIMFLVVGLLTITCGICVIIFMPDNPMTAKRLTHAERVAAVERVRENQSGVENKHFKPYMLWQSVCDPQTWLIFVIVTAASVPNGAVSSFQSLLIKGIGFTDKETALLQIPGGVISVASVLLATWVASRYNARCLNIMFWAAAGGILGGGLLAFLPEENKAGKMAGNYLTQVIGAFLPNSYSLAAANQAGHTKKVTMNAAVLIAFCLGNILGPITFRNEDAPLYTPARISIVATCGVAIIAAGALLLYYRDTNRKRNADMAGKAHITNIEFSDMTDKDNKEFRYAY